MVSLLGLAVACGSPEQQFVGELAAPVVYGADDRREVFEHPDEGLRRIARESIVALIPTPWIERDPNGNYSLYTFSLKDQRNLCDDEPFGNQPVAASCSGVLIDDDLVLTAGHCISADRPCSTFNYVFDYYLDAPNRLAAIEDEDVYSCRQVVLEADVPVGDLIPDFAVIQLDRPVEGDHAPVPVRPATALERGAQVSMIGFGSGLPAKIDAGANVADARPDQFDFFVVNLDAFEGHSGSATFDSNDRLAGILLGGRVPDYVTSDDEGCARANVFDDTEAGEIVHHVAPIFAAVCEAELGSERVCGTQACDGAPCGAPSVPNDPPDAAATNSPGCSAAASSPRGSAPLWGTLLLLWVARRLRRTAV